MWPHFETEDFKNSVMAFCLKPEHFPCSLYASRATYYPTLYHTYVELERAVLTSNTKIRVPIAADDDVFPSFSGVGYAIFPPYKVLSSLLLGRFCGNSLGAGENGKGEKGEILFSFPSYSFPSFPSSWKCEFLANLLRILTEIDSGLWMRWNVAIRACPDFSCFLWCGFCNFVCLFVFSFLLLCFCLLTLETGCWDRFTCSGGIWRILVNSGFFSCFHCLFTLGVRSCCGHPQDK